MTNSELFTAAHALARKTIAKFGPADYRVTFGACLVAVRADERDEVEDSKPLVATPRRLRDGSWGARVEGRAAVGDEVVITTRAGKSWTAVVTSVYSRSAFCTIVRTKSNTPSRSRRTPSRSRRPARSSFRRWDGSSQRMSAADAQLMEDLGHGYC